MNIFDALPSAPLPEESVDLLHDWSGGRIERIVSTGQASPKGFWYDQEEGEWIVLLSGIASLVLEDEPMPRVLRPGDSLYIPPHRRHRVEWTAVSEPTVWLAVFMKAIS